MPVEHKSGCLVCGKPLHYFQAQRELPCAYCGQRFLAGASCEAGHYVCDGCHGKKGVEAALSCFQTTGSKDPVAILERVMGNRFIYMHGPEHHILVGGALLAAYHNAGGALDRAEALAEMARRGGEAPGGACGFWGCCGAAISAGMYLSIALGATPLSNESWGLCNRLTAACLSAIGGLGGPRCCKRNAFTAARVAAAFTREHLGVAMELPETIRCGFFPQNRECLGARCPYNPAARLNAEGAPGK